MTTTFYTVVDAPALAEELNARIAAGEQLTINGFEVRYPYRTGRGPFRAYRSGSMSAWVRGNGANNVRTVWFRAGENLMVEA
jgi:hypothetical protein